MIWLELLNYFLIKLLIVTRQAVKWFLNNMQKPVCTICLNFPSKKINPFENFVEAAFDFNQMKSTRKFLSEKLVSYAEAYLNI